MFPFTLLFCITIMITGVLFYFTVDGVKGSESEEDMMVWHGVAMVAVAVVMFSPSHNKSEDRLSFVFLNDDDNQERE